MAGFSRGQGVPLHNDINQLGGLHQLQWNAL